MANKTLFDDTGSTYTGGLGISPSSEGPLAQSFSSGSAPILLTDLKLELDDSNPSDGGTITIELFTSAGLATGPGAEVGVLGTIADSTLTTSFASYDISFSNFFTLAANTTYWIELAATAGSGAQWDAANGASGTGVSGQEAFHRGATNSSFDFVMNLSGSAQETPFDDTGSTATGGLPLATGVANGGPLGQTFSTGSDPLSLTNLKLILADSTPSDGGTITITLCSYTAGQGPGAVLATLGTIADNTLTSSFATYSVNINNSPELSANTTYWIELSDSDNTTGAQWDGTNAPTGTGVSGQGIYAGGQFNGSDGLLMSVSGDQQTTVFSDASSPENAGGVTIGTASAGAVAESFNSGANPLTLSELQLILMDTTPSDGGTITVDLCSNGTNAPGSVVQTLGTIADSSLTSSPQTYNVNISSAPTLLANTTYWIELFSNSGASVAQWEVTTTPQGTGVSSQTATDNGNTKSGDAFFMTAGGSFCFAAGTRILTARGEVAVENLREEDMAVAFRAGRLAPIRWIGHRRVDLPSHPNPENINPVRIHAHAFGQGQPHTDLIVSPNHSIYVDGALIAVRYLLNGATIVQEAWQSVEYYHVELDTHDVLLANGLPAESYLDVGNRNAFANGGGPLVLHPEFAETIWAEQACAPFLDKGEPLTQLRATLLARAEQLGHTRTTDTALCVLAGRQTIQPVSLPGALRFDLPAGTDTVRLVSRSARPGHLQAEPGDGRLLGVGVASIALDGVPVPLDDPRLTAGWHEPEPTLRWTTGDAALRTAGARTLTVCLHAGITYWAEPERGDVERRMTA
jgi:hypothetical protein